MMVLRKPLSAFMLESAVGGAPTLIESFDTILISGSAFPCKVFCKREPEGEDQSSHQNPFANLLWLQALVRSTGFAEFKIPSSLTGSVAVVSGDEEFMALSFLPLAFSA
jgi:hypothetical protein